MGESTSEIKSGGKVLTAAPLIRAEKEMNYVSLHHHSTYSYLDGFALPESHVRRAAELAMPSLALTEHGNVSSHTKLAKAAKEHGVHPVFGCELYCGAVDDDRKTQRKNHLTVLAANATGYRNLLKVVSQGWSDFYYEPTVSGEVLARHKEGLVILSGCTGSLLATSLVGGKNVPEEQASYKRGRAVARRFKRTFGDAYYLEVQAFPELDKVRRINKMLERIGEELGIPLVATGDCHYTKPDENEMQQILHSVGRHKSLEQLAQNWGYDVALSPPLDDNNMYFKLRGTGLSKKAALQAIASTAEIANRCHVELPQMVPLRFPVPEGHTRDSYWKHLLREGWDYRKIDRRPNLKEYIARVKYEMQIIEDKDFVDYFLVVSDIVRFAKDRNIPVGPARGSAAASLVCYLLRITEVDPLLFANLIFERFIDYSRADLPDIDLDFDDERRVEVFEYAGQKYGREYVGKIGTFTFFKSKNSLDDVALVHKVPKFEVAKVKELLLERSSGDLRASATVEDTVEQFAAAKEVFEKYPVMWKATELEGNVKGMGIHAAGLVVATRPIREVCAVYTRTDKKGNVEIDDFGNPKEVISYDKYDAEENGLVKIDVLGLSTMGMIRIALEFIGQPLSWLYEIPLDDKETLRGFQENDCIGIFQFDGWAMRSVNGSVRPDNFGEVADVNALARPGPLHSNATLGYINAKRGETGGAETIHHPLLDPIVSSTNGQIVYQEQILRIVREIGKFDWTHASYIRKIISRKIGEQEFNRQFDKFQEGARSQGMDDETIKKIWGACITAGSYAFCLTGDAYVATGGGGSNGGHGYNLEDLWKAYNSKTALGQKLRNGQNGKRINLRQYDDDGRIRPRQFKSITRSDIPQPVYQVTLDNGMTFKGTMVHRVLSTDGYIKLSDVVPHQTQLVVEDRSYEYKQDYQRRLPYGERKGGTWADGNPAYADGRQALWEAAKRVADNRSKRRCEHCGTDTSPRFEYAHILSFNDCGGQIDKYHNGDNVLYLCNSCHKKFDYRKGERPGRDAVGRPTETAYVVDMQPAGIEYVYMIEMNDDNHNYVANGVVHHNNAAHSVSYGMLGFWTMYLKRNHPQAFYCAALIKLPKDKHLSLLRDAYNHGIIIKPPSYRNSGVTWRPVGKRSIRAGFSQVPTIGLKMGQVLLAERDRKPFESWGDLERVKGIGPKTVQKIRDFARKEDPFEIHKLPNKVAVVKDMVRQGMVPGAPMPMHKSIDVPSERGRDTEIAWAGVIVHRNLRDLFEVNFSRTGEALDMETVDRPDLPEWVIMHGQDETENISITINRYKYPRFKERIWNIELEKDIVIIRGIKKGFKNQRAIDVFDMWVLGNWPDEEESEETDAIA